MGLKGSRTEKNLLAAFAGESQARNRYTFYAGIASKEGYEGVAAIFLETADNERRHAKRYLDLRGGRDVEITAAYPTKIGNTAVNLEAAAAGEHEEWTHIYPTFGKIAEGEGFKGGAGSFFRVGGVAGGRVTGSGRGGGGGPGGSGGKGQVVRTSFARGGEKRMGPPP